MRHSAVSIQQVLGAVWSLLIEIRPAWGRRATLQSGARTGHEVELEAGRALEGTSDTRQFCAWLVGFAFAPGTVGHSWALLTIVGWFCAWLVTSHLWR